jgi:hypothetical protein
LWAGLPTSPPTNIPSRQLEQVFVALATLQVILAGAADQNVEAVGPAIAAAAQLVIAVTAGDDIVAATAVQVVLAVTTVDFGVNFGPIFLSSIFLSDLLPPAVRVLRARRRGRGPGRG